LEERFAVVAAEQEGEGEAGGVAGDPAGEELQKLGEFGGVYDVQVHSGHGGFFLRSFSCSRSRVLRRLTAAASRVRALPTRVILPVPVAGSAVPALVTASQPCWLRSPRQVGRTSPAR
jgi:hypothetical protein